MLGLLGWDRDDDDDGRGEWVVQQGRKAVDCTILVFVFFFLVSVPHSHDNHYPPKKFNGRTWR
jgi:hypothetical protein